MHVANETSMHFRMHFFLMMGSLMTFLLKDLRQTFCVSFIFFMGISNTAEAAVLFDDIAINNSSNLTMRNSLHAGIAEMRRRSGIGDLISKELLLKEPSASLMDMKNLIEQYNKQKNTARALGKENVPLASNGLTPVRNVIREKTDEITALREALAKEQLISQSLRFQAQMAQVADEELEKAQKQAYDFQVEIQKLKAEQLEFLTREQTLKAQHEQALDEERAISKQLAIEKQELKKNHKLQRDALLIKALKAIDEQRKLEKLLKITNKKHQETIQGLALELQKANEEIKLVNLINRAKARNDRDTEDSSDEAEELRKLVPIKSAAKLLGPRLDQIELDFIQWSHVIEAELDELCSTKENDT